MKKWFFVLPFVTNALFGVVSRSQVPEGDRWNLADLYPSPDAWQKEFASVAPKKNPPYFPELCLYKGKLHESVENLHKALVDNFAMDRKLTKLAVYVQLRHHEDIANPEAKADYDKLMRIAQELSQETAWIQPEIISLPEKRFKEYLNHPLLSEYKTFLARLYEQKPHVRSEKEEELMALALSAMGTASRTFTALNNADMRFGQIQDSQGRWHELTHGTYVSILQSPDRTLRKNAYIAHHSKYLECENSLTELLKGTVKNNVYLAKARNYRSCLEAALKPKDIDLQVYHSLLEAVRSRVTLLHRYMKLRKAALGLDELHAYDLYVPLVPELSKQYTFEEAEELVIESVKPLGEKYAKQLAAGLKTDRWVDRYENQNKRSGAYSSGCYDSFPYILMNFTGTLRDVFTLAHESGHSMHSLYSKQNQPFHYSDYSIFVAEVASTHNEELLHHMLLQRVATPEEKTYLINEKLDDLSQTLFRQTMLAEFELFIHDAEEKGVPLTPKLLKDKYEELFRYYSGPDLVFDPEIALGWARIPHLHSSFYVYQYATGVSAALCLSDKVLNGTPQDRDRYLEFLSAGSSDTPLNILAKAGCDMRTAKPVHRALDQYESLVNQLEQLMQKNSSQKE